jgi:hypothetical protein
MTYLYILIHSEELEHFTYISLPACARLPARLRLPVQEEHRPNRSNHSKGAVTRASRLPPTIPQPFRTE